MLSEKDNERLTRVGPGTPMGNLLRRYWMPVAISAEVDDVPRHKRLLGEDLVVFRTPGGKVGVVQDRCSHRRTQLTVGIVEADGIRCGYHGWKFGLDGKCLEQPPEPRMIPRADIVAYPAEELGGLVFCYMGPQPAPLLPRYDLFVMENCLRDVGWSHYKFNWLQAMENAVDPYHGEWLHGHFMNAVRARQGKPPVRHYARKHAKVGFDAFDYGIIKRRLLEGQREEEEDGWRIGHPLVFPNMVKIGGAGFQQFQIRVPMDDTNIWHLWYTIYTPPGKVPEQKVVPGYQVPIEDENGEPIVDFIDGQDAEAWGRQGPIADRTKELLGHADTGIAIYRQMLKENIERVEAGQDPMAVQRDAAKNRVIELPVEKSKNFADDKAYIAGILNAQAVCYSPQNKMLKELFGVADTVRA